MKRAIAMTLVLFLLSLGGFTAVTAWMCRTQEQVEFTNIVARGDESVARGLHMTEYDLLHSRVLWTTEHDLGTESRVTKTISITPSVRLPPTPSAACSRKRRS